MVKWAEYQEMCGNWKQKRKKFNGKGSDCKPQTRVRAQDEWGWLKEPQTWAGFLQRHCQNGCLLPKLKNKAHIR